MFAVLTYTDCAADESVSGRSGFQFQAESAEATPTDEHRISSGLLHVVPMGLAPERPEKHPPTCAYTAVDGRFYLARGRSTGRTLSGRPGNQVTQAIVTESAADILPLRPAQLYSSSSWSLQRAPAREVPGWEAPLEIDPAFETAGLHQLVVSESWSRDLLPRFLTMVEQATAEQRVKLIVVHPDQDVVMRWIALASLFEDGPRALELTFRVYAANPLAESAHIVGAHPALSPDLTPDRAVGCNVVDLDQRVATAVEVSPSAALHAAWFLEHDPYEALDAVETSRRWAAVVPAGSAALAASVACLEGAEQQAGRPGFAAALVALGALADGAHGDELEAYGDALLDVVVGRRPQPDDDIAALTTALWRLHEAGEGALAAGLALAGLEWAVQVPAAAGAWARSHPLPRSASEERQLNWADADSAAHAADLIGQVLAAAPDEELAHWFTLARALGTGLAADQVRTDIGRLARRWATRPDLTGSAFSWLHVDQVTLALQEELQVRFEAGEPAAIAALEAGSWDWLAGPGSAVDPERRPLSTWLASRTLRTSTPEERLRIVRQVAPRVPRWASAVFLERRGEQVTADEVVAWLGSHPMLSPGLAHLVEQVVRAGLRTGRPGPLERLAQALRADGVTGHTPMLKTFLHDVAQVSTTLRNATGQAADRRNDSLRGLATLPELWLRLYAGDLAELLLSVADESGIVSLSEAARGTLDGALELAIVRLARQVDVRALLGGLRLIQVDPGGLGRPARRGLARVWEDPAQSEVRDRLAASLPQDWAPLLQDFEGSLGKGRRTRAAVRNARRILDSKERH
ncbi:GAP1-N2 domain-containing protein [Modestobacter sp. VKM Ac-2984]|uniref:GAP1-N2 domain-containing protein n=1 Tax=Modestobacter sp. VKM Ac-2984 TaxID=3004138 RepID=UPI0022A9F8E5|nr:hypothetical protein [Modestobacter sp. VKM Ac-2984]